MPALSKATAKERALKLTKTLHKNKGSASAAAKELGIHRTSVYKRMKNPEYQSLRQQAIAKAAQRAGFTIDKIYQRLTEGLDSYLISSFKGDLIPDKDCPDFKERRETVKIGLELFQHIDHDVKDETKPTVINVHYGHRKRPPIKPE